MRTGSSSSGRIGESPNAGACRSTRWSLSTSRKSLWIRPWLYIHTCPHGHQIPILLLDTQLDQNSAEDRTLTHYLYGGDEAYALKQEIILGIGGIVSLAAALALPVAVADGGPFPDRDLILFLTFSVILVTWS